MPHLPDLRVVALDSILRHEEVDPLRVRRLMSRIEDDRVQVNPMVCVEGPGEVMVLLDGATRTEALRHMGLDDAVVQVVDPATVTLETWHHVVRGCDLEDLVGRIGADRELTLSEETGTPCLHLVDGTHRLVAGVGISANATLSALVSGYVGQWTVTRVIDASPDHASATFPDWAAVAEFPILSVDDVMKAAIGEDLLPAGITRFLVPDRALRLNAPLGLLRSELSVDAKQEALDAMLEERASEGRVRRYEEPVFVLDD